MIKSTTSPFHWSRCLLVFITQALNLAKTLSSSNPRLSSMHLPFLHQALPFLPCSYSKETWRTHSIAETWKNDADAWWYLLSLYKNIIVRLRTCVQNEAQFHCWLESRNRVDGYLEQRFAAPNEDVRDMSKDAYAHLDSMKRRLAQTQDNRNEHT